MTHWNDRLFILVFCNIAFLLLHIRRIDGNAICSSAGYIVGQTIEFQDTYVNQYLGVPYAEPPIGDLRFKKPKQIDGYCGTIEATSQPPACMQHSEYPLPWYDDQPPKSEDCLYLNIWTPSDASPENPKAVMYWIYGGGFFYGSIKQMFYDGQVFAARGDIVVVTVNYRMATFGFFFSGTDAAPGNVGMWDILAGLKWVKKNIEAFGGDPSNITIAGESAGSIAVGLLSVSPLARGLYARQIMQSGSPAYTVADNNTQSIVRSQKVAELLGCANEIFTVMDHPEEVTQCMRYVSAEEIAEADSKLGGAKAIVIPRFGDDLLPKNPRQAIIDGDFQCSNLLAGGCRDEGSIQLPRSNPSLFGFFGEKNPDINKTTAKDMAYKLISGTNIENPEAVVDFYLNESLGEDDYSAVKYQTYTGIGDALLLCPVVYYAEKCAEKGNRVYFYFWTHRPSTTPWTSWLGVPHFSDVEFLFGLPLKENSSYSSDEVLLSKDMVQFWSNFVKDGEPDYSWPLYSMRDPKFRYLHTGQPRTGEGPRGRNCDFLRPYLGFQ